MKIALVRYRYSAHGGAERYLDALASGLMSAGAEVRLLASSWEGEAASEVARERISVLERPKPLRFLLFARAVRRWAAANPGWLLFSLERVPGAEVYRAGDGCHAEWLARKRPLRPYSWPLDYARPLNLAYLQLERRMFASPDLLAVIANSARGRDEIARRFGVPPGKISVVYNGVDLSRFPLSRKPEAAALLKERLGIGTDETVFLFVGSGFARKGVGALAAAAALLARRGAGFRVVVVGKGEPAPYLRTVDAAGAAGRMIFAGAVPGAADFFLGADAFVFPTVYDPFSNACLEAMAAGLPVITTTANGASEALRDGESGFVLGDPLDAPALADRMERLLDPGLRRAMGAGARAAAQEHPAERNVAETLAVLACAWRAKTGS